MTNQPVSNQLTIREYMHKDNIIKSFVDVVGNERQANAYITSVLIAVSNSPKLQECTPASIMTSAMRAATLRLSCDPATKQAWLVPYGKTAVMVIGYKGYHDMAIRTGKYKYLNVGKLYEGEELSENRMTGVHELTGSKKSSKIIGYFLYFEMVSGYQKTFYMSIEEIHEHAKRYSPGYERPDGFWKKNPSEMERKTVLRLGLMKWGYYDPQDKLLIDQVDEQVIDSTASEVVDDDVEPEPEPMPAQVSAPRSEEEILSELGY